MAVPTATIHFVPPAEDDRRGVDFLEVTMDSVDEFLFGADTNLGQHCACDLAEEIFHQIQPGAVPRAI